MIENKKWFKAMNHPRRLIGCGDCKFFFGLKGVWGIGVEGECTRFPPSVHPAKKYRHGKSFSTYPLVASNHETCGEFKLGKYKQRSCADRNMEPRKDSDPRRAE